MIRRNPTLTQCSLFGSRCPVISTRSVCLRLNLFHNNATVFSASVWIKMNFLRLCKYTSLANMQLLKTYYQVYYKDKSIVNGISICDAENDNDGSDDDANCEIIDMTDYEDDEDEIEQIIVEVVDVSDSPIIVPDGNFVTSGI